MQYPNFNEERRLWKKGFKLVAGLDEVGRGPLAGPVLACAVVVNLGLIRNSELRKVKDSKKLNSKQREELYDVLTNHPKIKWGIGSVSEKMIDKINILQATKLAMNKAIKDLGVYPDHLILDGNFKIDSNILQKSIVKGDTKVFSISAASIIAKVTRDRLMEKYHRKYPQYGFAVNKGYPTKKHREVLKKIGPCLIHRRSFFFFSS